MGNGEGRPRDLYDWFDVSQSDGIELPASGTVVTLAGPDAWIAGIEVDPDEMVPIAIFFGPKGAGTLPERG